jgi:hypothetical protein
MMRDSLSKASFHLTLGVKKGVVEGCTNPQLSPHLENYLWVQSFCIDTLNEKSKMLENSEAVVETF